MVSIHSSMLIVVCIRGKRSHRTFVF